MDVTTVAAAAAVILQQQQLVLLNSNIYVHLIYFAKAILPGHPQLLPCSVRRA